ncbi:RES domain-containing protein [Roseobacter sp. HKCCD9010]|uniref:RES family NAD+ phosphorylase n=1 Tax=unclassified Roseobacter TaxID=196798 RepID=UPI001490A36C|nr:RES domain-containing protein [Rhodobacterales bacterium HKCCD4356]NNV14251.1 RES domain-containing protein [Roseobacter sp. HKCCD7357]NNV18635.1 RES domain-containing protein [Roseobacter sp. HKCCD8768]NNV28072.1 RES domain-containing protein [Roseobacter sp. HKCCD8192]NNV32365.1 RES domain-containing protein [Roseobacter sp. HKCCD9061]NNV36245.1 RES domain-containing protein [Roseobacter sp. HKCCD9073]NNV40720.1 RES domain-containing protein [Roseobacter sp. HKCCD9054]NNV44946.1 RES dom
MIPPKSPVNEQATVRLVPSGYAKPPVLSPLADSHKEEDLLASLEGLTGGRLVAEREGLPNLNPRELTYQIWGYTHINAAFAYTRDEGNRFNDKTRGAWYCAFEDLTALEEVAYHRTRELKRINVFDDEVQYQSLLASFVGDFHDVRGINPEPDYLGEGPKHAYPKGQLLASQLRAEDSLGIIYPSVRHPGGTCLVAFHPHSVQNVRFGARWKFTWNGIPEPIIESA